MSSSEVPAQRRGLLFKHHASAFIDSSIARRIRRLALILALICGVLPVKAKRPELDAVFFGDIKHNGGAAWLRPSFLGEFTVTAWLNGVQIAELAIPPSAAPDPSRYVLKVPLDDGVDPRLVGTGRAGERIRIRIIKRAWNFSDVVVAGTYEVNETKSGSGLSLSEFKGKTDQKALTVAEDLGGASPMMARFAVWRAERNFEAERFNPDVDTDGDGQSNFAEFLANTDPQSNSSTLRIQQIQRAHGVASIKVGPVKLTRKYTVWSSATLLPGDWQKVGEFTPSADAEFRWHDHVSSASKLFYRVEVNVQ